MITPNVGASRMYLGMEKVRSNGYFMVHNEIVPYWDLFS